MLSQRKVAYCIKLAGKKWHLQVACSVLGVHYFEPLKNPLGGDPEQAKGGIFKRCIFSNARRMTKDAKTVQRIPPLELIAPICRSCV